MSGLPLDDSPDGAPGLASGVFPHFEDRDAAEVPRLSTDELEWHEVRDALWLAHMLRPPVQEGDAPQPPQARPPDVPAGPDARTPKPTGPPEPPEPGPAPEDQEEPREPDHEPAPQDWRVGKPHPVRAAVLDRHAPAETAPLTWPTAPALANRRQIAKALRPLGRRVASPWRTELDEEETAVRAAQDRMWFPAFRPARSRRFELVVVIDTAGAADVWQQQVDELCDLFRRQGAFRDVRTLLVDGSVTNEEEVLLRTPGPDGVVRGWRDQIDPTGRTVFVVLTDGIGEGWRSDAVTRVVASWARHTPTAIVNLLPERLWHWSGLTPRRVRLRAAKPGAPNVRLRVENTDGSEDGHAVPIPVLSLDPVFWANWAKLLGTPGAGWVDSTTVFVEPDTRVIDVAGTPAQPRTELAPRDRVLRFRTFASASAFQLATLLAAVPLTMPTIKLVQRVMLPSADISAIAEVVLGGLLRKTSMKPDPVPQAAGDDGGDGVDGVGYEFHRGVRAELLAAGRRGDTIRVARLIAGYLGQRNPVLRNFREALDDPERTPEPEVTPENRPYLKVQEAVFRALSGRYAARATRLRRKRKINPPDVDVGEGAKLPQPEPPSRHEWTLPPPFEGDNMPASGSGQLEGRSLVRQPQIWGGVPLRNPDFVGREPLLEQLRRRLSEPGETTTAVLPEALHGMGGVGKSQSVVEYIYRNVSEYDIVWWIPAEHTTQIRSSFVELAKRLGITAGSAETAVPAVLEMLRSGIPDRKWILVFDNAERPDDVRPFLPPGSGHVVVTSRNAEWAGVARTVEVDLFTRSESIELLRRRGGGTISDEDADRLAEALGDLPLAVEQAAAWRAQTGMPVAEYVDLLEKNSAELLTAGATGEYELSVAAAWNVPLNRLRTDRRAALELLQVCAFFSPEPIARSLFTGVRGAPVPPALAEALADPIKLNSAIREIHRYSLAKIDHARNTIQLHRLVQAVLRDQLDKTKWEDTRHSVHLMLVNGDPGDPANSVNWPVYADLLPHAINSRAVDCEDSWVRTMVTNMVRYLLAVGDYQGGLSLAEEARETWTASIGETHVDTLVMGRHLANALRRIGRPADASTLSAEVYALTREHLGDDDETTIAMGNSTLVIHELEGRLYDERDAAETTLASARRVLGEDDPSTLVYANNYASTLRLTGEYFAARDLDQETLRRRTAVLGAHHTATLGTRSSLAMDIRECGDYVGACRMQEETCAVATEILGRDHPTTIGSDRCLAVARRKAGRHDQAMELTEDVYNRYRLRHGEGHLDTVTAMVDMATELRHLGELDKSLDFGVRGVRDFEKVYYHEHPYVMIAMTTLAVTRRLRGDLDEARNLNERAVAGLLERLYEDHPYVIVVRSNLASDLAELGEAEKARLLDEDTLVHSTERLGAEHPTTLAIAHNLSIDLNLLGQSEEAAILHTKTAASFRKVLGEEHPATVAASQNVRANFDSDTMQL
ncbi:FxSxx-COOH system tetratricopeptide repeat protein [Actinophytocola sp. NPDC049390]|uniref:FxSxx-COOH system tetratricopeptide repeat protein n=1 Tax=Actinophytocola sp. NPDC049390 TaxID=3363894 RepID=UPI003793776C